MNKLKRYLKRLLARWRHALTTGLPPEFSLLFDAAYYRSQDGPSGPVQGDELDHYLRLGHAEGRSPHPLLNTHFYRRHYGHLVPPGQSFLQHFLTEGQSGKFNPSEHFNAAWYLEQVPAARGQNPLLHYLRNFREQRPSPGFDPKFYIYAHADIFNSGSEPYSHWLKHGKAEGRAPLPKLEYIYFQHHVAVIDYLGGNIVHGWAVDLRQPEKVIPLQIWVEGVMIKEVQAGVNRHDLCIHFGLVNHQHGFGFDLSFDLRAGQKVELTSQDQDLRIPLAFPPLPRPAGAAPRVSIIQRTKNRPQLLRRAWISVLNQSFTDWELLVVNDGGDPAPVEALLASYQAEFQGRARVIHHDRSWGMEAASNDGIAQSQGEFYVIHDDDDAWHREFLQQTLARLEAAPASTGAVCTWSRRLDEVLGDEVNEYVCISNWKEKQAIHLGELLIENLFCPISLLVRRSAYDAVGPYREDLPVLGDWEFNLRLARRFDIASILAPLAFYYVRLTQGSLGNTVTDGLNIHEEVRAKLLAEGLRKAFAEPGAEAEYMNQLTALLKMYRDNWYY